jgi:hypothetical protein
MHRHHDHDVAAIIVDIYTSELHDRVPHLEGEMEHGGFTACQVEHHVRTKFATPILHAIDNFEN